MTKYEVITLLTALKKSSERADSKEVIVKDIEELISELKTQK